MLKTTRTRISLVVLAVAVGISLLPAMSLAQTGGGYNLTWYTIDAGGGTVSGGGYTLIATAGQPDTGADLTGDSYNLAGGFWFGAGIEKQIYLPLIIR